MGLNGGYEFIFLGLNFIVICIFFFFKVKNINQYYLWSTLGLIFVLYLFNNIMTQDQSIDWLILNIYLNINLIQSNIFFQVLVSWFTKLSINYSLMYNNAIIFNGFISKVKLLLIILYFLLSYLIYKYTKVLKINYLKFSIFLILICFCNLCIIAFQNLFLIIICMEIQNLGLIYLMSFKKSQLYLSQLNLRFFILNSFGSIFMFFGTILLYRYFFTFNLIEIYILISTINFSFLEMTQLTIIFGILFIVIGLFFKIGIGPFGLWMSDIYEYGPILSIVVFSIFPKVGYFMCLFHIFLFTSNFLYFWKLIFLSFGLFSIIIGTFGAVSQIKLKKLLAYSSINYFGYILLSFVGFNIKSLTLCILYLLIYIGLSFFIWYVLINLEKKLNRSLYIIDLVYLKSDNPLLLYGFIFCIISLSGLPPMNLFILKFLTFNIILKYSLICIIFLICNMISLFYYLRLIKIISVNTQLSKFYQLKLDYLFFYVLICICLYLILPIFQFEFDEFYLKNLIQNKN